MPINDSVLRIKDTHSELWVDRRDGYWHVSLNRGNNWENMDASELNSYLDADSGPWLFERYSYLKNNCSYLSICTNADQWSGLLRVFTLVKDDVPICDLPRIIFSNESCVDAQTFINLYATLQSELEELQ